MALKGIEKYEHKEEKVELGNKFDKMTPEEINKEFDTIKYKQEVEEGYYNALYDALSADDKEQRDSTLLETKSDIDALDNINVHESQEGIQEIVPEDIKKLIKKHKVEIRKDNTEIYFKVTTVLGMGGGAMPDMTDYKITFTKAGKGKMKVLVDKDRSTKDNKYGDKNIDESIATALDDILSRGTIDEDNENGIKQKFKDIKTICKHFFN